MNASDAGLYDTSSSPTRLRNRVVGGLLAITLLTPLVTARLLSPAVEGLGTHQQLGLPPCTMRVLFNLRCPACGMTTSWSHWTRGEWVASFLSNAGGACLAFLAVTLVGVAIKIVWTGYLPRPDNTLRIAWAIVAVGLVTVVDWIVRLSL